MSRIYSQTQQVFRRIDHNLTRLEREEDTSATLQGHITQSLQDAQARVQEYADTAQAELNISQKRQMLEKLEHVRNRLQEYQSRLTRAQRQIEQKAAISANRGELFQRSDGSRVRYDTAIAIDAQDESAFWTRSEAAVDGFISQGVSALENLREQRQMLKNARRNMFNVQGALGLSRTVIRNINRRTTQDKFILFGGMILTCFLIYLIIHYLG